MCNIIISLEETVLAERDCFCPGIERIYTLACWCVISEVTKQLTCRSQSLFSKLLFLNRNWRYKLETHKLPPARRNSRYSRFFELLSDATCLYRNLIATSVWLNRANSHKQFYSCTSHFRLMPHKIAGIQAGCKRESSHALSIPY